MAVFKPIIRKEGDLIESKDWNAMQTGLLEEIAKLRQELHSMSETLVMTGLDSRVGQSFNLDEKVRNEPVTYGEKTIGLITKQWLTLVPGEGEICSFGIMESFDQLYYWAGAADGDKNTLDINFEYSGRQPETVGKNLYINDRRGPPSDPAQNNPWLVAVRSVQNLNWYKYRIDNPYPDRQVLYVNFVNINKSCTPRVGNVIHLKSRLRPMPS
jgi:hypothetical protein